MSSGRLNGAIRHAAVGPVRSVWTSINERWYGISTISHGEHAQSPDVEEYATPDYLLLRRTARLLRRHIVSDDVFYDIGCGKGRVLAVMSRLPFSTLVGVELDPGLAKTAGENARRLRGSHAPIQIECANVLDVGLDEGTVFYFFNPFGSETMQSVVRMLGDSLSRRARRILVVYHNATYAPLFDDVGSFERVESFTTPGGLSVVFWRSRPNGNLRPLRQDASGR